MTTAVADLTETGADCIVSVRPEKIHTESGSNGYDNAIKAKFLTRHYVGDFIRYFFQLDDRHGAFALLGQ